MDALVALLVRQEGVELALHGRTLAGDGPVPLERQLLKVLPAEGQQALVRLGRREVQPGCLGDRALGIVTATHALSSTGWTS